MRRLAPVIALLGLGAVAAIVVYWSTIEHAAMVTVSGILAWRLLLGRAGVRRSSSWRRVWRLVETAWVGWVTVNVGRARRERISPEECQPIATMQPVYSRRHSRPAPAPFDEIPF